jgi:hypothetical protein
MREKIKTFQTKFSEKIKTFQTKLERKSKHFRQNLERKLKHILFAKHFSSKTVPFMIMWKKCTDVQVTDDKTADAHCIAGYQGLQIHTQDM